MTPATVRVGSSRPPEPPLLPVCTAADPAEWDGLLAAFPARTVFHRLDWLSLLAASHRLELHLLRVDDGGRCLAVWPLLQLRKGPFRVLGSPLPGWSTPYMGPLLATGAEAAVLRPCFELPLLRSASYVEARTAVLGQAADLDVFGFTRTRAFDTYLLDLLREEDELWRDLEGRCRNLVRKGEKNGIQVREECDGGFLDDFWAQSKAVFAKAGLRPGFTREFLQQLWERLAPNGHVTVLSAFAGSKRVATVLLLLDDRSAYYWMGTSDPGSLHLAPNNLLLWRAILLMRARGLATFDFVSSSGDAGRFKRSFGPVECTAAVHWGRSRTRVEGLLKSAYERFVRWRRASRQPQGAPPRD